MEPDSGVYKVVAWIGVLGLSAAIVIVGLRGDLIAVALLGLFTAASITMLLAPNGLPPLVDALFVIAAGINAAGWVWDLYTTVLGFDEVAHFFTSFAITLALGYYVFRAMRDPFSQQNGWRYFVVITSFGVTIGAWWEVAEWIFIDHLADPVSDIILDSFGALLAALVSLRLLRHDAERRGRSSGRAHVR